MATEAQLIASVKTAINTGNAVVKMAAKATMYNEIKLYAVIKRGDIYEPSYYTVECGRMMNDRYYAILYSVAGDNDLKYVLFDLDQAKSKDLFTFMNGKVSNESAAVLAAMKTDVHIGTWDDNPHD